MTKLTQQELERVQEGEQLAHLKEQAGWQVVDKWLRARAYHSWVNPNGLRKEDWEWAELNAYHSADVARQIIEDVEKAIADATKMPVWVADDPLTCVVRGCGRLLDDSNLLAKVRVTR